jgi:hypothetical protein
MGDESPSPQSHLHCQRLLPCGVARRADSLSIKGIIYLHLTRRIHNRNRNFARQDGNIVVEYQQRYQTS